MPIILFRPLSQPATLRFATSPLARTAPRPVLIVDIVDDGRDRLREHLGACLPIVLLSGAADLRATARAAGVVDALARPFTAKALLGCVRRHRFGDRSGL